MTPHFRVFYTSTFLHLEDLQQMFYQKNKRRTFIVFDKYSNKHFFLAKIIIANRTDIWENNVCAI